MALLILLWCRCVEKLMKQKAVGSNLMKLWSLWYCCWWAFPHKPGSEFKTCEKGSNIIECCLCITHARQFCMCFIVSSLQHCEVGTVILEETDWICPKSGSKLQFGCDRCQSSCSFYQTQCFSSRLLFRQAPPWAAWVMGLTSLSVLLDSSGYFSVFVLRSCFHLSV